MSDYDSFDDDTGSEFSFEDDSEVELHDKESDDHSLHGAPSNGTTPDDANLNHNGSTSYKQWTLQEFIEREILNPCLELKQLQLPQCELPDLLIMLQYYKWQKDGVINDYYDNYPKLMKNCGLVEPNIRDNSIQTRHLFTCMICCEDYDQIDTFSLSCDHEYCSDCYGEYVKSEVLQGRLIRCMEPQCSLVIPHQTVQELYEIGAPTETKNTRLYDFKFINVDAFNHKEMVSLINNILLRSAAKIYIDSRKSQFKWCPAPDCDTLIENLNYTQTAIDDLDELKYEPNQSNNISKVPIVACSKDHQFCYDCQYENHLPCPCWIVKLWVKKCQDDSETAHWLEANTHGCPKCHASIEKNGGCNHMTCPTCKYEFCWICLNDWKIHGTDYYKCNKFDPQIKESIELNQKQKRQSLQRYLHYYKRFSVHESSMKGDIKTLDMVNDKMRIFMEEQLKNNSTNLSWIDIQFLQDSFKALTNGRKTLKWAYCFEFYLNTSNYADVFEQMQEYLNRVVEDLSKIFEELNLRRNQDKSTQLIMKNKQDIINYTNLVIKRQKALIDCAESGLFQNLLTLDSR